MPMLAYFGVLLLDHFVKVLLECRTAHLTLFRRSAHLLEMRTELQRDIRALVEEFGPRIIADFDKNRVISKEAIAYDEALLGYGLIPDEANTSIRTPLLG